MICSSFGVDSAELLDAMGDDVGVRARQRARGGPDGAPAPEAAAAAGGRLASTPAGPYSCSPMDIFVYYNTPEVADANNCCEHQDYGHISADIFVGTPGLEVIDESAHLPGLYAADGVTLARWTRAVDGAALARLRSMGFDDERANAALEQHPGDVHAAVASLLA